MAGNVVVFKSSFSIFAIVTETYDLLSSINSQDLSLGL